MKSIAPFILSLFFILNVIAVSAQTNEFSAEWKKVEALEKKGLTRDALAQVQKIFDAAHKQKKEAQQIKAAMYLMKYRNMVEQDNAEKNIYFIDSLIAKTKAPTQNILLSMKAELLQSYKEANRWKIYNRSPLQQETSTDISTWSIQKMISSISQLYLASLQNESLLKKTNLLGLDAILQKGQNTAPLRPTLFDFLGHRALRFFMNQENDIVQPANKFILNDEKLFAPVQVFAQTAFTTSDTGSQYYNALLLLQRLLQFHLADGNSNALLDADLIRLQFANEHAVVTHKEQLYEAALLSIEKQFSNSTYAATAATMRAQLYINNAQQYHPFTNAAPRYDAIKAKDLLEAVIKKYPNSVGATNAKNMLTTMQQPELSLQTEKVNLPGEAFRTLINFKNIPAIHLRVISINRRMLRDLEMDGREALWNKLLQMEAIKQWSVTLPDTKDMQQHSTEIKIDALPAGAYLLLASIDPHFSMRQNLIARQAFYCSNIGFIYNNQNELYVLHRNTGMPLANATVQLWEEQYNYTSRKYDQTKRENFITDKNGLAKISLPQNRYSNTFQITYQKDELFTGDNYNNYTYNGYNNEASNHTFFFTDRSIYRPGQTLFFKGIAVQADAGGKNSKVLAGFKTTVSLYNANYEKVESLTVTTNEYGSFAAQFKLPEGQLNGAFIIKDEATNGQASFSVEEYKRPKFWVEIQKPVGSYRVNDSIVVKGQAKAYAGNAIDAATVAYRVLRKVQYPIWCGWGRSFWPPMGSKEQMEITNGITTTDADGNFTIRFKAIPDEAVDKNNQPLFYYDVMADVTDINGETRSAANEVQVSYQALQLNINAPEKLEADSLQQVKITSLNSNGIFEKTKITLRISKLQEPGRVFRKRYWPRPDEFVMNKEEYYKHFPYDVYAAEDEMPLWPVAQQLGEINDTSAASGHFSIKTPLAGSGWYQLVATTTDAFGEAVRAEKFIYLYSTAENKTAAPLLFSLQKNSVEPGEKLGYKMQTVFDNAWVIQNILRPGTDRSTQYLSLNATKAQTGELMATEADRGGIVLSYAFVKNNRVYSGINPVQVPWSNKELQISLATYRDKLLPGATEEWSMKLSGNKGEKIAAELLLSMYDASLNQFKDHQWPGLQSLWPVNSQSIYWNQQSFQSVHSNELNKYDYDYLPLPPKAYDELADYGWNPGYYGVMYMKNALRGKAPGVELMEEAMAAPAPATDSVAGKSEEESKNNEDDKLNTAKAAPVVGGDVQVRKNFNETAFFFPQLSTDTAGNVSFKFTMPEALTQWRLMAMGHTPDLKSGYLEHTVITQKNLMVQPNAPRFLREGDDLELSAKIVNMGNKEITGTARLELLDAATGKSVDGWFKNVFPTQYFTVEAGKSAVVKFPFGAPHNFNSALTYRIIAMAADGSMSDGEEMAIPVLSNRILVTETLPLNLRRTDSKTFSFDKLLQSANSNTISHQSLSVEYSSNPAWYVVQALPYLMEYPYECAEQSFNRYYANTLAAYAANSNPKLKAVFDKWKTADTAALLSNLQKNEELKSALLQETPWVLQAKTEAEQKRNIGILFNLQRLAKEKQSTFEKLREMQSPNGGFAWFKGGPDDRYITQYIITGIGHLQKLNALNSDDKAALNGIVKRALPYLDARLTDEYNDLIKHKVKLSDNQLSYAAIQYLYMRSFYKQPSIASKNEQAYQYYLQQAKKYWLSQGKYMQAMIGLALYRDKDEKTARAITASLKQNAIVHEELGMYWKEFAQGGYYWHQAPIESQALMIELFSDVEKNNDIVDDLKTWLLKQKQVQNWKTTKATAEAVYALLLNGSNWLAANPQVSISLGHTTVSNATGNAEAGTGYFKSVINGNKVQPEMGNITVRLTSTGATTNNGTTWGAAYWQYFEELDNITPAATPLKLVKKIFVEQPGPQGPSLKEVAAGDVLTVGSKVKVRIELRVDRDMEYVHMKDLRAAGTEPVNVLSTYKWQGGLGYYESTRDASTNFFFSWLPRGTYVFEYALFVSQAGHFSNGITTIQSMYAPEFSSHSQGLRLRFENK